MKCKLVLVFLCAAVASCTPCAEPDENNTIGICGVFDVPQCITERIEEFKKQPDAASVLTIVNNGERVYWFHEDNLTADDSEPVYNAQCEQVCDMDCECSGPFTNCPDGPISDWGVIWQK